VEEEEKEESVECRLRDVAAAGSPLYHGLHHALQFPITSSEETRRLLFLLCKRNKTGMGFEGSSMS